MLGESIVTKSLFDQRYYHFIVLHLNIDFPLTEFWNYLKSTWTIFPYYDDINYSDLEFQKRTIISDKRYTRGEFLREISKKKNGNPPYRYDLFAIKKKIDDHFYFVIGFPFSELALDVIDNLVQKKRFLDLGEFQKVDLLKLIEKSKYSVDSSIDYDQISIIAIQAIIVGNPYLKSVRLEGKNPLNSPIYQDILHEYLYTTKLALPEKCVFNCESNMGLVDGNKFEKRIHGHIHLDLFGNFKYYVQLNNENLLIIPNLIENLHFLECFESTSINPLKRYRNPENLILIKD